MKSEKEYPSCPHCGGLLFLDNDDYENYLTCLGCARSFNLNGESMAMTPSELKSRYGIELTKREKYANMEML